MGPCMQRVIDGSHSRGAGRGARAARTGPPGRRLERDAAWHRNRIPCCALTGTPARNTRAILGTMYLTVLHLSLSIDPRLIKPGRSRHQFTASAPPSLELGATDNAAMRRRLALGLLLLMPLAHGVRSGMPLRSSRIAIPPRMAAFPPSVDPALKLVLRAAGDRGKADLSSLRALAGLIGLDDGLRALEGQLGISEDATDAEIQARRSSRPAAGTIAAPTLHHPKPPHPSPTLNPSPHPTAPAARAVSHAGRPAAPRGEPAARPRRSPAGSGGRPACPGRRRRLARRQRGRRRVTAAARP